MSAEFKESLWNELIDILKKYNIDFDKRIKDLIPEKVRVVPSPPARVTPRPAISMELNLDDEHSTLLQNMRSDPSR